MDSSEIGFKLIKHGNIRIEIHFATATTHTLMVIIIILCLLNTTTCWRLIKTEMLFLTTQHEHVANRTVAQERFENQNHLLKSLCVGSVGKTYFSVCCFINSDPSSEPRKLWVAVYFDKREREEYFDSYGLSPTLVGLKFYMDAYSFSG